MSTPCETLVPLTAFEPDQSPDAVHDVGLFVALHVRDGLTTLTVPLVGLADMVTTGGEPATLTVTGSESLLEPLSQVIVYVCEEKRAPVDTPVELLRAPPVEKFVPEQEVALRDDHVRLADEPVGIVIGASELLAFMSATGRGGGV